MATMLWIGLELPNLALDAVNRGGCRSGDLPTANSGYDRVEADTLMPDLAVVVTDGPATRPRLYAINPAARDAGMNVGMSLASARVMDALLIALPRAPDKEAQCVRQIAAWCAQFTPSVSLHARGVVLEVSASLRLFGGIAKLVTRIRQGMVAMGYRALIGVAPTPLAAQLLAKMTHYQTGVRMCQHGTQFHERLACLPLSLFDWPPETVCTLSTLGWTRIKDVLIQPRDGLRRRFGEPLLNDLDRALGKIPDPRMFITLPDQFTSTIEFVFELIDSERLLHPITAMLTEMEGFLRARGAGVTGLRVSLKHRRDDFTEMIFDTRTPAREVKHWLRLIRERFNAVSLKTAVVAITLKAECLCPFDEVNESLFPDPENRGRKRDSLMDRLSSRLGDGHVFSIAIKDDHRPEASWRRGTQHKRVDVPGKRANQSLPAALNATHLGAPPSTRQAAPRPTWLLPEPRSLIVINARPHYHGALTILAGPERIDTGWWDNQPVARDYFVAKNPRQEVCWIFKDYRLGKRWYLHGLFA